MKPYIIYFLCIALAYGQKTKYASKPNVIQAQERKADKSDPYYGVAKPWRVHPDLLDQTQWTLSPQQPQGSRGSARASRSYKPPPPLGHLQSHQSGKKLRWSPAQSRIERSLRSSS